MSCSGYMPAPVCLIENYENGKLCVRKDAKEILDAIKEPVVVVSMVGLYRMGKSYLMNRLAGRQSGFALGNTVKSKTKGIWMWCLPHPNKEGHTLVLLDTEGLGDVKKGDSKNDGWILFCSAALLCTTAAAPKITMHYVTELTEQIKIRSAEAADEKEEENSKFVQFFPSFIWVVRDFTLDLEINGNRVTEDEYLEFALDLKKGVSKKISDYSLPRECIQHYFPSRKCFVFPFPVISQENMMHLESLQEQDLAQAFLEVTGHFCDHIYVNSAEKTLKRGHRVTGKMLGHLVEIYVDTISSGRLPCLDNAVVTLANLENQAAVQEAFKVYQSGMEEVKNTFLISTDHFTCEHKKFSSLATSEFMKRSFKDEKGEYLKKMEAEAVLNEFLNERGAEANSILYTDKKLTENERQIKEEKENAALLEQKFKEEEEKRIESERMIAAENERHEDRVRQMKEKFKQEMEQHRQEIDRAIKSKLKEQVEMLNKGFREKATNLL